MVDNSIIKAILGEELGRLYELSLPTEKYETYYVKEVFNGLPLNPSYITD